MASPNTIPYLRKITQTQEMIESNLAKVKELEKALKTKRPSEQKKKLEMELDDIKESILIKEAELKDCYGENRKTFMFAVFIMFFSFLVYVVYLMIFGPDQKVELVNLS